MTVFVARTLLVLGLAAVPLAAPPGPAAASVMTGIGGLGPGETLELPVTGRAGVPATGVEAVVLNLTATGPTAPTYLTVYPTGAPRPTASNLNVAAGETRAALVVAPVGADGRVSVFNLAGGVDVVADVVGWFPDGGDYHAVVPARLAETRPGLPTVDGRVAGTGRLGAGGTLDVPVAGRGGVPASGVGTVLVNVTGTGASLPTYLTVHPTGRPVPLASNVNVGAGGTAANLVAVPLGADGRITVFNLAGDVDVVVDVVGWTGSGGSLVGTAPARLLDTRPGFATADGVAAGAGAVPPGGTVRFPVVGRGGVPTTGVGAAVLNITATDPTAASYVTAWSGATSKPGTSTLNVRRGDTVPNLAIVPVAGDGSVSLYNLAGSTHLVADVLGWLPSGGSFRAVGPERMLDTRVIAGTQELLANQYASGGVPARPDRDRRLAAHDIRLKGVPDGYDWYAGARVDVDRQWWDQYGWTNLWFHVYVRDGVTSPLGLRVELRNPRIMQLRADGSWEVLAFRDPVGAALYDGAVRRATPMPGGAIRREPSGSYSVSLAQLGLPGFDTIHGWWGTWPRTPFVRGAPYQGLVYVAQMRLVDDAGTPVDWAGTTYAAAVGADVFTGAEQQEPQNDVGIPRYKVLTGDWQTFSLTNLSPERLAANPPPGG